MKSVTELSILHRFSLSLVVFTILLLGGCGVGDFIGAYFNTYYNARKVFNEVEQEMLKPSALPGSSRTEKPFLAPFDVPSQAKAKFTTVIEKCSKLLQYHPDSKLVDDALLMIGKSYYYQNEHQSAERKFNELLSTHPESDVRFETKLLLANTHYRKGDKEAAARSALELIEEARKEDEDEIVSRAANLVAQIETEARNFKEALQYYQIAADLGATAADRSSAYRAVASMYIQQGEYAKAKEAYTRAEDVSNDYLSAFRAQMGQARMFSMLGRHEESLALLETLISNKNYREFFGEIDLEIAHVYREEEDYPSAEAQYRYVDTAYARTEVAANSYFHLGQLYEKNLMNYDSARVAYESGKGEFPQAEITPATVKRSEFFIKYFQHSTEIARNDSIRQFILHPPDSSKRLRNVLAQDTTMSDSAKAVAAAADSLARVASAPPPMDTVMARLSYNISELAALFYSRLEVLDSAKYWYNRLLVEHPKSAFTPRALYTLSEIYRGDSTVSASVVDSLQQEIVKRFPESEFAASSRRSLGLPESRMGVDSMEASYRRAEALAQKGDIVAALVSFKNIAERDSPLSAKAQYTIGWIYENTRSNTDSSIAYYQRLIKRFPNSQYASLVQPKLAEVEMERQRKLQEAKKDSAARQTLQPPVPEPPVPPDSTGQSAKDKVMERIPVQETGRDSLYDERPINKNPHKKDEEIPKP